MVEECIPEAPLSHVPLGQVQMTGKALIENTFVLRGLQWFVPSISQGPACVVAEGGSSPVPQLRRNLIQSVDSLRVRHPDRPGFFKKQKAEGHSLSCCSESNHLGWRVPPCKRYGYQFGRGWKKTLKSKRNHRHRARARELFPALVQLLVAAGQPKQSLDVGFGFKACEDEYIDAAL